jgi:hypothetical protein
MVSSPSLLLFSAVLLTTESELEVAPGTTILDGHFIWDGSCVDELDIEKPVPAP